MRRQKSLRNGVHHADGVVWGPVYRTHLLLARDSMLRHVHVRHDAVLTEVRLDPVDAVPRVGVVDPADVHARTRALALALCRARRRRGGASVTPPSVAVPAAAPAVGLPRFPPRVAHRDFHAGDVVRGRVRERFLHPLFVMERREPVRARLSRLRISRDVHVEDFAKLGEVQSQRLARQVHAVVVDAEVRLPGRREDRDVARHRVPPAESWARGAACDAA
eukprot:31477-Pelagococcus_subviridis.AAC.20